MKYCRDAVKNCGPCQKVRLLRYVTDRFQATQPAPLVQFQEPESPRPIVTRSQMHSVMDGVTEAIGRGTGIEMQGASGVEVKKMDMNVQV